MDHAARRRLIYLLLRNGEIGRQPQSDDTAQVVTSGDRHYVESLDTDAPVDEHVVDRDRQRAAADGGPGRPQAGPGAVGGVSVAPVEDAA
jgi:hypothetical protein